MLRPAVRKDSHCSLASVVDSNHEESTLDPMYVPYKVEPRMKAGSSSGRMMNRNPAQRRSMASLGALLQADGE